MPSVIESDAQVCSCCGGAMLQKAPQACKVLSENCVWDCTLNESECRACGSGSFDGSELLMLRKITFRSDGALGTFELLFHWDLLFKAQQELEKGHFFFDKWMRQMDTYKNLGLSDAELCAMSKSLYRHFREAVIDCVELMDIDYSQALRCACAEPLQSLVADGVMLSCGLSKLHLLGPWLPQEQDGEPLLQYEGSLYDSRFAVRDDALRSELRAWASVKGVDLSAFELTMRRCTIALGEDVAAALRGLAIHEERVRVVEWARELVRELGVDSPACAAVPAPAVDLVLEWADVTRGALQRPAAERGDTMAAWSTPTRIRALREAVPVLYRALRVVQRQAVLAEPEDVGAVSVLLRLITDLAEVRPYTSNLAYLVVIEVLPLQNWCGSTGAHDM